MYKSYWQIGAKPFENTADTRFYFPSEAHQGALLKLRYAIENRGGCALLCGASGQGKTLLIHTLWQQLSEEFSPLVNLVFPQMPADQLLAYLADELTGDYPQRQLTTERNLRRLQTALVDNSQAGRHAVIVIDEAQLLRDTGALETARLLLNFEYDACPMLTLILVGQPSLLPALDRMPELESRISVKCLLRPFHLEETIAYVNHRLQAAGAERTIFDESAMQALHQHSQGNPRHINRLCDLALLIGFAEEQSTIGSTQIEAVAEELLAVVPE